MNEGVEDEFGDANSVCGMDICLRRKDVGDIRTDVTKLFSQWAG